MKRFLIPLFLLSLSAALAAEPPARSTMQRTSDSLTVRSDTTITPGKSGTEEAATPKRLPSIHFKKVCWLPFKRAQYS